jgi:predicted regulator of amino acid metabolism with ACT domain
MRCVGDRYNPQPFITYCPKLIAARYPFPDEATENRTISHFAYETEREDIPIHLKDEFWNESLNLRNKLLLWRLRNKKNTLKEDTEFLHAKINPRLKEVIYPLSAIIEDLNVKASLKSLTEILNHNILEVRSTSDEATVLSAILSMMSEQKSLTVKNISDRIKAFEPNYPYDFLPPKKLGWFLRNRLGLRVERVYDKEKNTNPYTVVLDGDFEKITRLARQYGVNEETITSITSITESKWCEGEETATQNKAIHHLPKIIEVSEVIDVIGWIKEVTQQGKEAISAPIVYGQIKQKFNDDFEKSMALLNWLTTEKIITVNSDTVTFNLLSAVFLEANLKRLEAK